MRLIHLFFALLILGLAACGSQAERDPRLAEILSAPVPQGVSPRLWHELTRELARVVAIQRSVSTPPTNLSSTTTLEYDSDLGVLTWGYYFSGDYDQNGVVSVSDLTPLAIHLGESVTDVDSAVGVCDGDGNLAVTVADLTPIGVNLGKHIAGYRIYSADTEAPYPALPTARNGNGATLAGDVLFSEATGDKASQRLAFSFDIPAPVADTYYWVRPYDGADDGTPSNNLLVEPSDVPNQVPVARLVVTSLGSATPLKVNLSAVTSSDDHGIVKYEWDLDGNGVYEYDSGADADTSTWFYGAGTFDVGVRVSDAEGLSSTKTASVEVGESAVWHTQVVDETVGQAAEVLLVESKPAVLYRQKPNPDHLVYRRATNDKAESWGPASVIEDETFGPGRDVSAAMINDDPAVVFSVESGSTPVPAFALAADSLGGTWSQRVDLSPPFLADPGTYSLAQIGGLPAFAYAADRLYFLRATDPTGNSWTAPLEIGVKAQDCSLKEIAGTPAVAFFRREYGDLMYVSAEDAMGTAWLFPTMVDDQGFVGEDANLIDADGHPAIAYYDDSYEALKFVRATNPQGTAWEEPIFLAKKVSPFLAMSKLQDGRLAIVFRTRDAELLWIASNDLKGESWCQAVVAATDIAFIQSPSLEAGGLNPYVVYGQPEASSSPETVGFAAYY